MAEQDPYVFDSIAKVYDSTRALPQDVMDQVVEALFRQLDGSHRILDVGVGTGRFAVPLSERGLRIVGIDLAEEMMAKARDKGFGSLVRASATQMPFEGASFDAATMVHVLHLIPDWRKALSEVSRTVVGSLYTVATERERNHAPRAVYERLLEELGYGPAFLGVHERDLAKILRPDDIWPVCRYEETLETDEMIGAISRREFSWATRLPDGLHDQVVQEIREKCVQKKESIMHSMLVYRWEARRLANLP